MPSPTPAAPAGTPATTPSSGLPAATTGVLGLLAAVAPFAMDLHLPVLPAMADELGATASQAQLTLTTFLAGLALGQLVFGPISDRWGRRRPMLVGAVVCLVASIACVVAPSIGVLLVARTLQGLGGAAGVVLGRAVIVDRTSGASAARLFAALMAIQGVAPVIAPLVGGPVGERFGWRWIFAILAVLAAAMLVGAIVAVPESLPVERRGTSGAGRFLRDAREVVVAAPYLGYTVAFAASFAAMTAYVSASPFVLQHVLGLSVVQYSLVFAANALFLGVLTVVGGNLAGSIGPRRVLALGLVLMTSATVVLLLVVTLLDAPRWPTLVLLFVAVSSLGLVLSNGAALATAEAAHRAGTGSAVMGALQFTLAAVVSPLVGLRGDDPLLMAVVMLTCALLAAGALLVARRAVDRRDGTALEEAELDAELDAELEAADLAAAELEA